MAVTEAVEPGTGGSEDERRKARHAGPSRRAASATSRPERAAAGGSGRQPAAGGGWNPDEAVPAPNPFVSPDRLQVVEALARWAVALARRPDVVGRQLARTGAELAKVALGRSKVAPPPGDGRFADVTWRENPAFRRLMQAYLTERDGVHALLDQAGLDPQLANRARFVVNLITEAAAPTNSLLTNPAAVKRAYETGGRSVVRGVAHLLQDLRRNRGMPAQADTRKFSLGGNLACTPGAVVHRTEMFELLQYSPTTPRTLEVPLLMVPAQLNKYYVVDLAPGRSLLEFTLSRQIPTFAMSWRNPGPEHRDWGLDAYVAAVTEASDVARAVTGSDAVNLAGYCAGGLTVALSLAYLAARGESLVNSATLLVTALDWDVDSQLVAFAGPRTVTTALRGSRSKGIISGRQMNTFLSLLRPNELVWQFWVNNYLLGEDPPAFDMLYWNRDNTNLPHAFHADVLRQFVENPLGRGGAMDVLGTPVDLRQVKVDAYVLAGLRDHISPWRSCYRTVNLLGGPSQFVLTSSGHIAAIVSDPGNEKTSYHFGPASGEDPDRWLASAQRAQGSWWPDWTDWLAAHSGSLRRAGGRLGSRRYPPLGAAPGQYVLG